MIDSIPAEIAEQLSKAKNIVEQHFASTLLAIHLYGSALDGGMKPCSDIDLLVTVSVRPDEVLRQSLATELLNISAPPGDSETLRALEVTVVVLDDIVPWRYPPRRELQFGEWQRSDILSGVIEPAVADPDLAILLTKAREKSIALIGQHANHLFHPVPAADFYRVLSETLELWNSPPDWQNDERHVVLTLARIWYSAATGRIASKEYAAGWVVEQLPAEYRPVLLEARQAYLGHGEDCLASRGNQLTEFILFAKDEIVKVLKVHRQNRADRPASHS